MLMDRWTKCVVKQGDYVEKLDTNNFYKYSCKKVIMRFLLFNDLNLRIDPFGNRTGNIYACSAVDRMRVTGGKSKYS